MGAIEHLQEALNAIEHDIQELTKKREAIAGVLEAWGHTNGSIEEEKPVSVKESAKPIVLKSGQHMNFSKFVLNILQSNPDTVYTFAELTKITEKAISKGQITKVPTTSISTAIYGRLNYYIGVNKVTKSKENGELTFQIKSGEPKTKKQKKEKSSSQDLDLSSEDETVYNIFIQHPNSVYAPSDISAKVRQSTDYNEIAKNLSGTLQDFVDQCLEMLTDKGLISSDSHGNYKLA